MRSDVLANAVEGLLAFLRRLLRRAPRLEERALSAADFVHLTPDRGHLLRPDNTPFFVLGVNYEGYYDRAWRLWEDNLFDAALIEKDFRKAREAGFDAARLFVQRALARDVQRGNFTKLDTVLDLARRHNLYILLTFNDYHDPNLTAVAALDAQIAQRYASEPIIMGYDLENEPGFYSFATAQYPSDHPAPIQTTALVDHYGERKSQEEVDAWRQTRAGRRVVPARLSSWLGYLYANAYFLYLEFLRAATDWVRSHGGTTLDYMDSPDSAPWQPFLDVCNGTVGAWLESLMGPIRAVDPYHLITVGYNNPIFAKQPANQVLDFQSYHRYGSMSLWGLRATFNILDNIRASFPGQPFTLGEFGYSNARGTTPPAATPVDPALTSIYETAIYLHFLAEDLDGAYKWMLNDVKDAYNPYEGNFGVFRVGDQPKPISHAMASLAAYRQKSRERGEIALQEDNVTGVRYVYSAADALFAGGSGYQDERLAFKPIGPAQLFVSWTSPEEISVATTGPGAVTVNPTDFIDGWDTEKPVAVYRLEGEARTREVLLPAGGPVTFTAEARGTYILIPETVLTTWYFAQALPRPPSQQWVLLMNPHSQPANVTLTLTKEDGEAVTHGYTIQPTSRLSIPAHELLPSAVAATQIESDGFIYAERTAYFGHDGITSKGARAPARTWYFAEGYTGPGYETWLLLHNPGLDEVQVRLTFARDDGQTVTKEYRLQPTSFRPIQVNPLVPNRPFGTQVVADRPIIAERAVYFGQGGGHGTIGAAALSKLWYLPEGYTGPGYTTWLLLHNPNQVPANVTVTFMKGDGTTVRRDYQVGPTTRFTWRLNRIVPGIAFATLVKADQPLVAERASYFAGGRGGHCSIGATTLARTWYLPEGSTAAGHLFVLTMNPNSVEAQVTVTFMKEDGSTVSREYTLKPTSRHTVNVNRIVPNSKVATQVTSDQPLAVERAMYFNDGRGGTASLGLLPLA
ncbi:MAG: hypothetical protein ACE5NP_05385 [Anaerolineae bacterium]